MTEKRIFAAAIVLFIAYVVGAIFVAFIKAAVIILVIVIVVSAFCGGGTFAWEKYQERKNTPGV